MSRQLLWHMYSFPLAISCCVKISNVPNKFFKYIDVPLFKAATVGVRGVTQFGRISKGDGLGFCSSNNSSSNHRSNKLWEIMDPQTKNDSDKTQDICTPYVGHGYV